MKNYYCAHIDNSKQKEWDTLVALNPASGFHQSFGWAKLRSAQGHEIYKIGLFEHETDVLVGGLMAIEFAFKNNTNFLYIPEGPVLNYESSDLFSQWRVLETALHSITNLKKDVQTTHIRIEPRIEKIPDWFLLGWVKAPYNLQPRHTEVVDLRRSEEELLSAMKPKCRYNIKYAQKNGVVITQKNSSETKAFLKVYKQTFSRNKFEGKDKKFFGLLSGALHDKIIIFEAQYGKKILASAIVVYFGTRATYLYGASSNTDRNLMAPYLLHAEIMRDAKAKGYTEYDFWGIAPDEEDTAHEWHGITAFKKKFGGKQLDFIGAYDYVLQQKSYSAFVEKHES